MNRGKALQPERDCDYCGKPLVALRHPNAKYCDTICRGRDRYAQEHDEPGLKCLDCGKVFVRVGSHVVQVHGYESAAEYRVEHGLMAKETRTDEHAACMSEKAQAYDFNNLELGEPHRYREGGDHGEQVTEFWKNRKAKAEYTKLNKTLRGKRA